MAKKNKESTTKTDAKAPPKPLDPQRARDLIRLLNTLALLLAILAFLLQFFAVLSPHWKWQRTNLHGLVTPYDPNLESTAYEDSRLEQNYGLYCRDVRLLARHDEQLHAAASTRFPRVDNGHDSLHYCLARSGTLRGSLLTCSDRLFSPEDCHCRRYPHWNAVIFFEVTALVLLGLVVIVAAVLHTKLPAILKLVGAALAFLAFIFLLIGLILILSYLKRETRSLADIYPHKYHQLADQIGLAQNQRHAHVQKIRRQAIIRNYQLLPGQHPHNETHYQEYSQAENAWVYRPFSSKNLAAPIPRQQTHFQAPTTTRRTTTTEAPLYNPYGPAIGYEQVYNHTQAGLGWSSVLSILALILSLLIPLILAYSWLTSKKLEPKAPTVTTTTVRTEYTSVPQEVVVETVPLNRTAEHETIVTTTTVRPGTYDNYTKDETNAHHA